MVLLQKFFPLVFLFALLISSVCLRADEISLKVDRKYLNIPVSHKVERARMSISVKGNTEREFVIRLADATPDYWVFCDISDLKGETITISYLKDSEGLSQIYQSDTIAGQDLIYKEKNRPQYHFTTRRGWINDPNGLVWLDGEYHLFYQHNPYERDWENMHWGHAVSRDLLHWAELPEALYPDKNGMAFSGSAVMDYDNTAGFNKKNNVAMIAYYTAASPEKQVQCMAYSLDNGRNWTKYEKNPAIDSRDKWGSVDTRDPKIFRYKPGNAWVMVLNERDGHSIYTSSDLKEWNYQSHIAGFWECPDLFELPVDGNPDNTKWVMYGASGTYMIGLFDGKQFTPEKGKYCYTRGAMYAAQTFSNIPASDGRRIQIGWLQLSHPDMPFNGMMSLPTELTLRTTKDGVRLFNMPVKEVEGLLLPAETFTGLNVEEANKVLKNVDFSGGLRIRTTIVLSHATSAGLTLNGQALVDYDMNRNTINGVFYSPEDMTGMELTAEIYIDRTSIEVFVDNGAYSYSMGRHLNNQDGFNFWGNNITVKELTVNQVKSVW